VLKLTCSDVEFQKFSRGTSPESRFRGRERGPEGRKGNRKGKETRERRDRGRRK